MPEIITQLFMQQDPHPDSIIHHSRLLPATPDQVFSAFENSEKLATWWGPAGFTNTFSTFEFVPGGNWLFTMHAPNGADFANESIFREIVRDSRIVLEHTVTPWFRLTVALTPEGQGTLLTWDQEFDSPEMATKMRPLAATANVQVLDRLQALLTENRITRARMKKNLAAEDSADLFAILKARFEKHPERHKGIPWSDVESRLDDHPAKLWSLAEMERTGGEPDVVGQDKKTGEFLFYDCSPESPKGRVSVCYDREGWESRKEHRPANNAIDMAAAMGIEILTEEEYQHLQTLGKFDQKTSTWVKTPADLRKLGGALFGDRRFGRVFIYHNGAQSYYSARGFRGVLRV